MLYVIKCEKVTEWDFDHCLECKRFRLARGKGLKNWRCSLNSETPKERYNFSMVWARLCMQNYGVDITIPEVKVVYVGKRKRKRKVDVL